jgi:hypothetical protein
VKPVKSALPLILVMLAGIALFLTCCATSPRALPPVRGIRILAEEVVTVAGEGGAAEIPFSAKVGQKILITMLSESFRMEPYGYLEAPNGDGFYTPENGQSAGGLNSSEVTTAEGGGYTLTVFDGSNRGGVVHVRIELLE